MERKKGNRTIKRGFTLADSYGLYNSMTRKNGLKSLIGRYGLIPKG